MENTETKNRLQNVARETAESAKKVGGRIRAFAGDAADASRRWAQRGGEVLSDSAEFATLQVRQGMVRRRLDRAYLELGRSVYAAHEKGEEADPLAEIPAVRAALDRVRETAKSLS